MRRKEQEAVAAAADLEDAAAQRRQQVSLWQEQRRAAQQAEEAERRQREAAAELWTLEDDLENEFLLVSGRAAAALAQDFTGSGEVEPLAAVVAEASVKETLDAAGDDNDEIDSLDAYMASEIAPVQVCISGLPSTLQYKPQQ